MTKENEVIKFTKSTILDTELLNLMKHRRSVRKYKKNPVHLETIYKILEAGRYAPSGANSQPWIYIVVTENGLKEKIRKEAEKIEKRFHKNASNSLKLWLKKQKITYKKIFLTEAPTLVVVAGLTTAPYWLESTWISIAYILLSVKSQNLGTLTYTPSETDFLNKLLDIPKQYQPVAILPIGEPEEKDHTIKNRKPLKQTVYLNHYIDK
jgi:nitroreductase